MLWKKVKICQRNPETVRVLFRISGHTAKRGSVNGQVLYMFG